MVSNGQVNSLDIKVIHSRELSPNLRREIVSLCNRAYEEDIEFIFNTFVGATHIIGYYNDIFVSHALWITRYLQMGTGPYMRTAYVELVASESNYRRRGFASSIMKYLIGEIQDYELAALSPFSVAYYERLGWERWRGPLFIRTKAGLMPTPVGEDVMVYRLPRTPVLYLTASLSAEWREGELW